MIVYTVADDFAFCVRVGVGGCVYTALHFFTRPINDPGPLSS